ncbi:MAG: viroplasmin family protein [Saprospiraceae bacterium]
MAKYKQKYYVVWAGHNPGIYDTWEDCQIQTKTFSKPQFKSFPTLEEAVEAFRGSYWDYAGKSAKSGKSTTATLSPEARKAINWNTISVDAACSGNPGVTEYQGVNTQTKKQIFHVKLDIGTNNIGEFLALVHALAMFKKAGKNTPIYTDSKTAMAWVRKKKAKTTFKKTPATEYTHQLIQRAEKWLKANTFTNPILKWKTEEWGEIPADFGRK